jgi:hypothetical protein
MMNMNAMKKFAVGFSGVFAQSIMLVLLAVMVALGLAGCGKQDPNRVTKQAEPVSFQTLESNRQMASANAEFNARLYRTSNPRFDTHSIVPHTDSTITNECPQGDGWATVSIMKVGPEIDARGKPLVDKYSVKCSTVSASVGCYLETDFVKKSFAGEENNCQPVNKVPFPLPKLNK